MFRIVIKQGHPFSLNNLYWTGQGWSSDKQEGGLFRSKDDAELIIQELKRRALLSANCFIEEVLDD